MTKTSLALVPFLTLAVMGAQAQTAAAPAPAPEPFPFTANIAVTSNYKFRGQDQGSNRPALQGGFDWSQNGFYIGNWNSSIGFTNAGVEMDVYGGYRGAITEALAYDVGLLAYLYPQKSKEVNFNTYEVYGALTYSFFTLKYSHTVSKDYFGYGESQQATASGEGVSIGRPKGRNTGYIELNATVPLIDKLSLNGHVGYTRYSKDLRNADYTVGGIETDIGLPNYADYKLGVTYDLGNGFAVAGAVAGANKKDFYGRPNRARAIFTISKAM